MKAEADKDIRDMGMFYQDALQQMNIFLENTYYLYNIAIHDIETAFP